MDQDPAGSLRRSATTEIVSAYVGHNSVHASELPKLIQTVYASMKVLQSSKPIEPATVAPAISAKRSITPDYLISLEDGRPYKSLKRHLSRHGLTPQQYRQKWELPYDYPMVAPNYAKRRSELARAIGLGSQARRDIAEASIRTDPFRHGRPRKSS